ncbi:DUF6444 domain-containing protein [Geminocystis sp. NIES-3709]|uniref:DUF6444 domain-containing protein n=1 Tax=Geminocystis sp. NIES-3709 TaxID=1617448 RepID=UPI0005FCA58C|nr:DUF6444 domain-containing protein [Geminocystis sp. NIES-3709]BAQ64068.1 mobile element protein [Geminocystis sp. NIES-3709]
MIIEEQNPKIIALEKENEAVKKEVLALLEKIAQLEKRLGLNSQNSFKPPSIGGFKTPSRTQSLREKSQKNSGGQSGHKGYTLSPVSKPDHIIEHLAPDSCEKCGYDVREEKVISLITRQVFDIPEPKIEVTEHQVLVKQCPHCWEKIQGNFPKEVKAPVQYGSRIRAISAYLNNQHFIPEDRLSELMWDLFDCRRKTPEKRG